MIFDSHMHTELSSDSKMTIDEVIKRGQDLNIGTILTEHMDYNYPVPNLFKVDCDKFFDKYGKYRSDNLLLGIEIGLSKSILDKNNELSKKYPFDFILGSIHSINDIDIFSDPNKDFISKKDYFISYFNEMIRDIKDFDNFDSLAHIDYPCRYLNFKDNEIYFNEFPDYIDEVFKIIISKGKVLELNSRRIDIKASKDALLELYKRYRELGGKYITLGSDAHNKESIGMNFDIALDMAHEAKLTPIYFKERKPKIITL